MFTMPNLNNKIRTLPTLEALPTAKSPEKILNKQRKQYSIFIEPFGTAKDIQDHIVEDADQRKLSDFMT